MSCGWCPPLLILVAMAAAGAAHAAENGSLIRAETLREQPFIDAAAVDSLAANEAVAIAARQGGWMQVGARGKTGWVKMLNVRLAGGGSTGGSGGLMAAASLFRTGSSGTTVTTGVKGLSEEDLRNAQPDRAQLAALAAQATTPAAASAQASANGLKPNEVAYLKAGKPPKGKKK